MSNDIISAINTVFKPALDNFGELISDITNTIGDIALAPSNLAGIEIIDKFGQRVVARGESINDAVVDLTCVELQCSRDKLNPYHWLTMLVSDFIDKFHEPIKNVMLMHHDAEDFEAIYKLCKEIVAKVHVPLSELAISYTTYVERYLSVVRNPQAPEVRVSDWVRFHDSVIVNVLMNSVNTSYNKLYEVACKHIYLYENVGFKVEEFNEQLEADAARFEEEGKRQLALDEFGIVPHDPDSPLHPDNQIVHPRSLNRSFNIFDGVANQEIGGECREYTEEDKVEAIATLSALNAYSENYGVDENGNPIKQMADPGLLDSTNSITPVADNSNCSSGGSDE